MNYPKNSNTQLNDYFNSNEFDCHCEDPECKETKIHPALISILTTIRLQYKKPITITSGFRCKEHNENIGGSKNSQHLLGYAADIQVHAYAPSKVQEHASDICVPGLGCYSTFTHIDVRDDIARWNG